MTQNELDLLDGYLHGTLDEADFARLQTLLREDVGARQTLRTLSTVDTKLHQLAGIDPSTLRLLAEPVRESRQALRWFSWRPVWAAAAGIVFGVFCTSMVFGFVAQAGRVAERKVEVLVEGFEDEQTPPRNAFPKAANVWAGDLSAPVGSVDDVKPVEGSHMVRLVPESKRKFSYARRIVDLAEHPAVAAGESVLLEVSAAFNTPDAARSARYQIRLAAFNEAPADVRAIWNNEAVLFDTVLQHAGRNVQTKPGSTGWQKVQAVMQIPPGTRSVVISLAAGEEETATTQVDHYLDDVQARFVVTQSPVE